MLLMLGLVGLLTHIIEERSEKGTSLHFSLKKKSNNYQLIKAKEKTHCKRFGMAARTVRIELTGENLMLVNCLSHVYEEYF